MVFCKAGDLVVDDEQQPPQPQDPKKRVVGTVVADLELSDFDGGAVVFRDRRNHTTTVAAGRWMG